MKIFLFFIFLYQPCIISNLFSILQCISLNPQPGGSYILRNLKEKCFSEQHFIWILAFDLPCILFFIVLLPIWEFWKEKKEKSLINSMIYW